jgi:hypothetical protein
MKKGHMIIRRCLSAFLFCVTGISIAAGTGEAASGDDGASPSRISLGLGFSHWFGSTFGSPDGYTTPAAYIGIRPGVPFLCVQLRYSLSLVEHSLVGDENDRVGFASLEVLANREFRADGQAVNLFAGPLALMDHAGLDGAGWGYGIALGAEYLFPSERRLGHRVGIFLGAREVFYVLPGDDARLFSDPRRDGQIDLGVVTTLF